MRVSKRLSAPALFDLTGRVAVVTGGNGGNWSQHCARIGRSRGCGEPRQSPIFLKRLLQSSSEIPHRLFGSARQQPASVPGLVCDGVAQERFDATRNRTN